jgi:alpha-beta hydrolase superfamily lysophospholipase
VNPRGTLIVLAGRGETNGVYQRLGRRLSADAYRVRVVGDVTADPASSALLVRGLLDESSPDLPRVLVGSDAGALLALRIAAQHPAGLTGVVVAGLPLDRGGATDQVDAVALRSACPGHRGVLLDPTLVDLHAVERPIPADLAAPAPEVLRVPLLAVHGAADQVAPLEAARAYVGSAAHGRIAVVDAGRHDILNDVSHRSVAATVVLFLEQLRNAGVPTVELLAS